MREGGTENVADATVQDILRSLKVINLNQESLENLKSFYDPKTCKKFPHEASSTIKYLVDKIIRETPVYSNYGHGHASGHRPGCGGVNNV